MKKTLLIILGSAFAATIMFKAAPAIAADAAATDARISHVRTADLDLRSEAGRRQLDRRLIDAAREVCGPVSDVDVAGKNRARACVAETLAEGRKQRDTLVAAAARGTAIAVTAAR